MGLLDLSALMSQFEPTDADRADARRQALLAAGLGLLGARKGQEMDRLGQVGLLGLQTYNNALTTREKAAMEKMQAASTAMQIQEQQQKLSDQDALRQAMIGTQGAAPANPMQSAMAQAPSLSPTNANVSAVTQAADSTPAPGIYEMMKVKAQALMDAGQKQGNAYVYQQGLAMLEQAQKLAPKYKGLETVMQNGKPVLLQTFDNQAPQTLPGYQPKPDFKSFDTGSTTGFIDPLTSALGPTFNKTVTPDATLSSQTAMRGQDITMRGQNLTDARAAQNLALRKQELTGPDGPLTADAIKNAAARYNIDGTLPPMGMGLTAASYRSAILNEAARQAQAQGLGPDEQRGLQLQNKASASALSQVTKQEGMVGAFEKNFVRNADLALQQSAKVDRTGVPIVNKWINAGKRAVTGDPDLSAFDTVVKATVNEYSKILSGSMGNQAMAEGEIKKVEGLLSAAQTPQQVQAVINMMKQETANRMTGFKEQKSEIMQSMRGGGQPGTSGRVIDFNSLPK